jgi:hypothetical protein
MSRVGQNRTYENTAYLDTPYPYMENFNRIRIRMTVHGFWPTVHIRHMYGLNRVYAVYGPYLQDQGSIPSNSSLLSEVVDGAKVMKMFLFRCKSCLNNITRCFMKFEARWTTPVVWAEIQFKFWH